MSAPTTVTSEFSLQAYRAVINEALEQFFTDLPEILHLDLSSQSLDALEKLREYSLRPGKRIRGSLASFAYDYATGEQYGEAGVQAAVALELVQNYLLIVDDVMDRSDVRRGLPTVHQLYLQEQTEAEKDLHLANMLAVNVGLIAQHLVNIVLARIDQDAPRIQQATLLMHRNIAATGFGQIDDACQQVGKVFSEEDIIRKYRMKSSYYTFVNPIQIGLVLGGVVDQKTLDEVEDFGLAAGIAFQLKDDLLGVFGESETTGKPNTDDVEEGKYTLLVQYAFDHGSDKDITYLKSVLGTPDVSNEDMTKVQAILESCGAKQYVEDTIRKYAKEAHVAMEQSKFWSVEAKAMLIGIVDYSINRKR